MPSMPASFSTQNLRENCEAGEQESLLAFRVSEVRGNQEPASCSFIERACLTADLVAFFNLTAGLIGGLPSCVGWSKSVLPILAF